MSSATLVRCLSFDLSIWRLQPTTYRGSFVALTVNETRNVFKDISDNIFG